MMPPDEYGVKVQSSSNATQPEAHSSPSPGRLEPRPRQEPGQVAPDQEPRVVPCPSNPDQPFDSRTCLEGNIHVAQPDRVQPIHTG